MIFTKEYFTNLLFHRDLIGGKWVKRFNTWEGRNSDKIEIAVNRAKEKFKDKCTRVNDFQPYGITVMEIGVGAQVRFLSRFHPKGPKTNWTTGDYLQRLWINWIDSTLRHAPYFKLQQLEHTDIVHAIAKAGIPVRHYYVVDDSERILDLFKDYPASQVTTLKRDITREDIGQTADLVFCYNTISRIPEKEEGLARVLKTPEPSTGLLSMDTGRLNMDTGLFKGFELTDMCLYERK